MYAMVWVARIRPFYFTFAMITFSHFSSSLSRSLPATFAQEMKVVLKVQDLHSIIPQEFLQISSCVVHPLSYQQAKNYNL